MERCLSKAPCERRFGKVTWKGWRGKRACVMPLRDVPSNSAIDMLADRALVEALEQYTYLCACAISFRGATRRLHKETCAESSSGMARIVGEVVVSQVGLWNWQALVILRLGRAWPRATSLYAGPISAPTSCKTLCPSG